MKNVIPTLLFFLCFYACKAQHSILKEKIKVIYFNADDPKETTELGIYQTKIPFYRYNKNNIKNVERIFAVGHVMYVYDKRKNKKIYIPKDSLDNYEILKYYEDREEEIEKIIDLTRKDSIFVYETRRIDPPAI